MPPKKKDHITCINLKGNSIPFLRCIRNQKENIAFFGDEKNAQRCCLCPCEKGKKIMEEKLVAEKKEVNESATLKELTVVDMLRKEREGYVEAASECYRRIKVIDEMLEKYATI